MRSAACGVPLQAQCPLFLLFKHAVLAGVFRGVIPVQDSVYQIKPGFPVAVDQLFAGAYAILVKADIVHCAVVGKDLRLKSAELEPELQRIRQQGYAVDNNEYHAGLCSVAAPIYDENGAVSYAFSIVSMFHQADTPEFRHARNLALVAARDISFALGYRGDAFANVVESAETSGLLVPDNRRGRWQP